MWEQIQTLISSTPLVQGGLLVALSGLLFEQVRRVPATIWDFIIRRVTVTLTVGNEFDIYSQVLDYVQNIKRGKFRSIGLYGSKSSFGSRTEWGFYRGRLYSVHKTREKNGGAYSSRPVIAETLVFVFYTFSPKLVEQFVADIVATTQKKDKRYLRLPGHEDWYKAGEIKDRALDTVILPEGTKERLIADYEAFTVKKDFYESLGIPYRRGYLLAGPPGTGKTSLVKAMATKYGKDIHTLSLRDRTDAGLSASLRELPPGAFVLIEDIDSLFEQRKKTDDNESHVSFSGLLNAIDGIEDSDGRVLFVTTNHPERLDPALFRPGRLDYHVKFDYLTPEQASRYLTLFYGEPTTVADVPTMTVAQLQELCLTNSRASALSNLKNLGTVTETGATVGSSD